MGFINIGNNFILQPSRNIVHRLRGHQLLDLEVNPALFRVEGDYIIDIRTGKAYYVDDPLIYGVLNGIPSYVPDVVEDGGGTPST